MLPPQRGTPAAVSVPAEKERAQNWEERKQQSNWAQRRPTHGSEMCPNRTHNNTQGNHEVRALQQPPNAAHAERAISNPPPPPLPLQGAHVLHKGGGCAPRAVRCPPRGWQPGRDQPTAHGTVHVVRRYEILVRGGGQAGGTGVGVRQRHPGAPTNRGRSNTDTQNAGPTPGGTRANRAEKEEGHSKAGEATRTAQNGADGRVCAWEAATIKGMAWPASPIATGCQGNPCSTGIRWGVSPAAQMGCLRNRSGSPSGADQP